MAGLAPQGGSDDPLVPVLAPADIVNVLLFMRLYTAVRYIRERSILGSRQARLVGALNGIEFDASFTMKTLLHTHQMTMTSALMLALLIIGAYIVFCLERTHEYEGAPDTYLSAMWLIYISAATVGYGDILPVTSLGRAVTAAIVGVAVVLTAVQVAVVTKKLQLSHREHNVIKVLEDEAFARIREEAAARVMQAAARFHLAGLREQEEKAKLKVAGDRPRESATGSGGPGGKGRWRWTVGGSGARGPEGTGPRGPRAVASMASCCQATDAGASVGRRPATAPEAPALPRIADASGRSLSLVSSDGTETDTDHSKPGNTLVVPPQIDESADPESSKGPTSVQGQRAPRVSGSSRALGLVRASAVMPRPAAHTDRIVAQMRLFAAIEHFRALRIAIANRSRSEMEVLRDMVLDAISSELDRAVAQIEADATATREKLTHAGAQSLQFRVALDVLRQEQQVDRAELRARLSRMEDMLARAVGGASRAVTPHQPPPADGAVAGPLPETTVEPAPQPPVI